jgi:hypothetical protein
VKGAGLQLGDAPVELRPRLGGRGAELVTVHALELVGFGHASEDGLLPHANAELVARRARTPDAPDSYLEVFVLAMRSGEKQFDRRTGDDAPRRGDPGESAGNIGRRSRVRRVGVRR